MAVDSAVNKTVGNAVDNTTPGSEGGKPVVMEQMLIYPTMSRAGAGWDHG